MIQDGHEAAGLKAATDAATAAFVRIESADAKGGHQPHMRSNGCGRVTFVGMNAALLHNHSVTAAAGEQPATAMAGHVRRLEPRNVGHPQRVAFGFRQMLGGRRQGLSRGRCRCQPASALKVRH
jgi:hypothetical protein